MAISLLIKNNLRNIPPGFGQLINRIPYSKRPGIASIYRERKKELKFLGEADIEIQQTFVFERMKAIVDHAYQNVVFYKDFYNSLGFNPSDLQSFKDIQKIPIVTKAILNEYDIEDRSSKKNGRYVVNTGGSSGTPFSFYIEPSSMGHEWAHMHTIWSKLKYRPSDLKLLFGGRSDVKDAVDYDVVRNHFAIDIYQDYRVVAKKLRVILKKYKIKYLHGYPSSIYDFALYCDQNDKELRDLLKRNLVGAFLGSEYPHRHHRETIERVFGIDTISWYGHTERAVLAYEKEEKFTYEPFLSYGFSEAIKNGQGGYNLVSTSYYNEASPFIRYNTQDTVELPIAEGGVLKSFKILTGREGEFVVDAKHKSINLTALVFGRHHELFNHVNYIQIKQLDIGKIIVYYVGNDLPKNAEELFDRSNLDFEIRFERVSEPFRTQSGKFSLLVK